MDPSLEIPLAIVAPFALLLLSIATLPLVAHHWWENNRNRGIVAAVFALPVAIWCVATGRLTDLGHAAHEYQQFIVLLGSLFVISGGIFVGGDLRATPRVNTGFLALGAVLASVIGTTGASMVLIRPLLRTNSERQHVVHTVVFFILIVSNCGGLLTPLGDPPLFMGYLRGVPFTWTFGLWPQWLGINAALLLTYFIWDSRAAKTETPAALRFDREHVEPVHVAGKANLVLLAVVVAAVALVTKNSLLRDGILVACTLVSLFFLPKAPRERNVFTWGPIVEVAVLFAGIFVTMIPALRYLEGHGAELGVHTPRQFLWVTGSLSAFLDNAPTYLTFTSVAASHLNGVDPAANVTSENLRTLLAAEGGPAILTGISLGAVLMGAITYIGNGPNFMVKAVAESAGVRMPGFFGYMVYSVAVLVPMLLVVSYFLV
ncbi:MAG: sodium:proton antiporter [Planctomycetes bacterium]|nr:sodium:proton antiporter [Planctomycetota bacterium]